MGMALCRLLLAVCVVGSAADNATTSTVTTTMTMTTTAQSQQNTSTNSSNSSTTSSTAKKEVKGTLTFDVTSQQQCNDMAGTNGITGLKSMLSTASGGIDVANVAVTVTCTAKRRLSDGRRLTAYTAAVAYVISVPAGSTITAEAAKTNLVAIDNAGWTTRITNSMSQQGITVNVSNMVKTDPTVTTVSDVSFAASIFSVGAAGVFAWMILALR